LKSHLLNLETKVVGIAITFHFKVKGLETRAKIFHFIVRDLET